MRDGKYFFATEGQKLFIKLSGHLSYLNCSGFESFLSEVMQGKEYKDILIDLTEVTHMDSTNLGLIARSAEFCRINEFHSPTIISNNSNVNKLLTSVGFDDVMNIYAKCNDNDKYSLTPISSADNQPNKLCEIMYKSHLMLCELNDKNNQTFRNVVEHLKQNLDS